MLELKTFDFESRKTIARIAKSASPKTDPDTFKEVFSALKKKGLIDTQPSRGGGCWLTEAGRAYAQRLDE